MSRVVARGGDAMETNVTQTRVVGAGYVQVPAWMENPDPETTSVTTYNGGDPVYAYGPKKGEAMVFDLSAANTSTATLRIDPIAGPIDFGFKIEPQQGLRVRGIVTPERKPRRVPRWSATWNVAASAT